MLIASMVENELPVTGVGNAVGATVDDGAVVADVTHPQLASVGLHAPLHTPNSGRQT